MESLDINGKDIILIRNLYWNQIAYMRTEAGLSPEIHIKRGVRQGCVLSPCLLPVYKKHLWSNEYQQSIKIGGTTVKIICVTLMILFYWLKLQEMSIEVNHIEDTFDMKMNAKKTNTMLVSKYVTLTKVSLTTDGDIIKQTDNYTSKGKCDDEILKKN